tara:strand:- start:37 stop:708 length:672 start_codon:yes stop_codon:yes gene_type:complete
MTKNVLVVVAHPDDEAFGCAGLILNLKQSKYNVYAIYLTDGESARNNNKSKIFERKNSAVKSAKILGFKWLLNHCGIFKDQKLDSYPRIEIIQLIEKIKKKIKPKIIITHSKSDLNLDHRIVFDSVVTAFRPKKNEKWNTIISCEIPSATDYGYKNIFNANFILGIEKYWKKKIRAISAYKAELLKFPNSRSLKGIKILNQNRGIQHGLKLAEAYEIYKYVKR